MMLKCCRIEMQQKQNRNIMMFIWHKEILHKCCMLRIFREYEETLRVEILGIMLEASMTK